MRCDAAIRVFDETRKRAGRTPTWRLKTWTLCAQVRSGLRRTDANLLRLIALQYELRHRPQI